MFILKLLKYTLLSQLGHINMHKKNVIVLQPNFCLVSDLLGQQILNIDSLLLVVKTSQLSIASSESVTINDTSTTS